ncbi:MAG TPA: hypothetical protein VG123_40275 [Streptosporangiaceae bacterium]|nr:hypothetical protein [Streptosporangiaceae bacterium]
MLSSTHPPASTSARPRTRAANSPASAASSSPRPANTGLIIRLAISP